MTRFERLLQSELRADRVEEPHLDADQISAFLANRASCRESVMVHASRCAECRQVLFLASGELAPPVRSNASMLRWAWFPAAVTVCAIALVLFMLVSRGRMEAPATLALSFPAPPAAPEPSVMPRHPATSKTAVSATSILDANPPSGSAETFVEAQPTAQASKQSEEAAARVKQFTVDQGIPEQSTDSGTTWTQISIDPTTHFHAIGNVRNDVWAGGSAGALFHSSDLGEHWQRVKVVEGNAPLISEILRLRVVTPLEIRLFIANGERWVTKDGGLTWQRE